MVVRVVVRTSVRIAISVRLPVHRHAIDIEHRIGSRTDIRDSARRIAVADQEEQDEECRDPSDKQIPVTEMDERGGTKNDNE